MTWQVKTSGTKRLFGCELVAGLLACSSGVHCSRSDVGAFDNTSDVDRPCLYSERRWYELPTGTSLSLKGVFGDETQTAWAVGQEGLVMTFHNGAWQVADVIHVNVFDTIDGNAALGLVAAGWNEERLDTDAGTGAGLGSRTCVYRRDGNRWERLDTDLRGKARGLAVHGNTIHVVGSDANRGRLWTWAGGTWTETQLGFSEVREVAFLADRMMLLVEDNEHCSVVAWEEDGAEPLAELPLESRLNDLVVHADGTLTVVGRAPNGNGLVLQGPSSDLTERHIGGAQELRAVSAASENDVYAVGDGGTIVHYDGRSWELMKSGISENLFGVWASSATGNVFAVGEGGKALRFACPGDAPLPSQEWAPLPCANRILSTVPGRELYGIAAVGTKDALIAGTGGVYRLRGSGVEPIWTRSNATLYAIRAEGETAYAVGDDADSGKMLVLECGTERCSEWEFDRSGMLAAVWVQEDQVITAGYEPDPSSPASSVVLRLNRNDQQVERITTVEAVYVEELWGESPNDLWAVGTDWNPEQPVGVVLHFDGIAWEREAEVLGIPLYAIAGSPVTLNAGGHSYSADATGRLGTLLGRPNGSWRESGLDDNFGVISLYSGDARLLAGAIRAVMPTGELTFEWLDLTEPTKPSVVCANGQPIEDIGALGDGTLVAVGHDGEIYAVQ
jgi:hypothetical protein